MVTNVRIKFDKLLGETPRAYLLLFGGKEVWMPSKMCRNFTTNRKLGGHAVIPSWLYKEKFGYDPNEEELFTGRLTSEAFIHNRPDYEAETIIERHKPNSVDAIASNEINELKYEKD